ncbi:MAG: bifunctional allantoicase/(S)-ureidoglycine aminohydrolase [Cypionkella sp.]|nr:bifunctional allantoicase/(S)-ureidoglycine aminohydrolase [Cypionkella sp.]
MSGYFSPAGGLPAQTALMTGRAMFTEAFAFIPRGCFSDIVTSYLPHWTGTRMWLIARPMTGFSETFSQYVMEVAAGGGSDTPDADPSAEHFLFVTDGEMQITIGGAAYKMTAGGYAFIPPATAWTLKATTTAHFHWLRKRYEPVAGVETPIPFVTREQDHPINMMPGTNGAWGTTRFVDPADIRHDAHVNIVTFQPGGVIPFEETHVMEHGLFVLQGKAVYKLNQTWVEVEAGDFMWLRAYCPQACYAAGSEPFRYLLYKDVNRHAALRGVFAR